MRRKISTFESRAPEFKYKVVVSYTYVGKNDADEKIPNDLGWSYWQSSRHV